MRGVRLLPVALLSSLPACSPGFDSDPSRIAERRVLAMTAEPPEVVAGMDTEVSVLVVSPEGTDDDAAPAWALCTAPKGPAEDNVVAGDCLGEAALMPLGTGRTASATVPFDACARFGPDVPPQPPGAPPLRPRDPDETGGYYQPVRAALPSLPMTFGLVRIVCGPSGATPEAAAELRRRYRANRNPRLLELQPWRNDSPLDPAALPAATRIEWRATWSDDSAEDFPQIDGTGTALVDRRESLRLSWFASAGHFEAERTGVAEGEAATGSSNGWQAPDAGGTVHLWLVLRDSRGGTATLERTATVVR